jgi:hypothetical protein
MFETYVKRLEKLEEIALSFPAWSAASRSRPAASCASS